MPQIVIPLVAGSVPNGFCPTGATSQAQWQSAAEMLAGILTGRISGTDNIVRSASTPSAADQGKLWVKLDAYGMPVGIFYFGGGQWIWPNPRGQGELMAWKLSEAQLWLYDGGDPGWDPSQVITATTGPMWIADPEMGGNKQFRFFVGAGKSESTYNGQAATVLSQGQVGGEEKHVLSVDEILHQHAIGTVCENPGDAGGNHGFKQIAFETRPSVQLSSNVPGYVSWLWPGDSVGGHSDGGTSVDIASANMYAAKVGVVTDNPIANDDDHPNTVTNQTPPAPTALATMPPYRVGIWAVRSQRLFYRGS